MKFRTGLTTELTQKHQGQSTKMTYVHPNIYINKYPRFLIELPLIVSCSLAKYIYVYMYGILDIFLEYLRIFKQSIFPHTECCILDTPMCLSVDLDSCICVCMAELPLNDSHKHKHKKRGGAGGNEGAQEETRGRRRPRLFTFTAYLKFCKSLG